MLTLDDTDNLIAIVADEENLIAAFHSAKKECSWKQSVQEYEANILDETYRLHKELLEGTYKPRNYFEFTLRERGKVREIKACNIRDRVVQKSLCDNILNPILTPKLIYDNGASLKGKGISFSRGRLEHHLHKYYREYGTNEGYILQIDFSKFFASIPHEPLLKKVEDVLPNDSCNWLIELLVNSFDGDKGLGIGSQISQIFGLFYPTEIDTYCKVVKGLKYYARYMDDIYIIHPDKKYLQQLLVEITEIANTLGLVVNMRKTKICKIDRTFIYLKIRYFLTETGKVVKKMHRDSITRERRRLKRFAGDRVEIPYKDIENAYRSWRGGTREFNSRRSLRQMDLLYDELFIKPFLTGEYLEYHQITETEILMRKMQLI